MRIELLADEEEGTEVRTAHWISTCEARTLRERTKTATAAGAALLLPSHQHQCILLHSQRTDEPLKRMNRVTFGVSSSLFAANMVPSTRSDASRDPRRVGLELSTSDSCLWRESHDEDESAAVHQLE